MSLLFSCSNIIYAKNSQSFEKEIYPFIVPRMSNRPRNSSERFIDFLLTEKYEIKILKFEEPITHKQDLMSEDSKKWLEAMRSEMASMTENQVYDLDDFLDGVTPIGFKWGFIVKTDKDGNIHVDKERMVTKGFVQVHVVYYDKIFSLVAMLKSTRILLAIATFYDYKIWQMDVKATLLNGFLKKDAYMT